jgi:hypothetical protein
VEVGVRGTGVGDRFMTRKHFLESPGTLPEALMLGGTPRTQTTANQYFRLTVAAGAGVQAGCHSRPALSLSALEISVLT